MAREELGANLPSIVLPEEVRAAELIPLVVAREGEVRAADRPAFERREIADFIKENQIKGVCILHGDAHMLAADNGADSDYATGGGAPLPVLGAAPLDQDGSIKGGPYSQGVYRPLKGEGCFGLVTVQDQGDHLRVIYSGRNHLNQQRIGLSFQVPALNR